MEHSGREIGMLRMLIGCGEKAVETFEAADHRVDKDFVADLRRVVARSRDELALLEERRPQS